MVIRECLGKRQMMKVQTGGQCTKFALARQSAGNPLTIAAMPQLLTARHRHNQTA